MEEHVDWFVSFSPSRCTGPTFATSRVLQEMKLNLSDIGVIEFHEAFAGQVRFAILYVSWHVVTY